MTHKTYVNHKLTTTYL